MDDFFTSEEKKELFSLYRHLMQSAGDSISWRDCQKLKKHLIKAAQCNGLQRNNFGMNPVIRDLQTAVIVAEEIGMKGSCLIGIMLHEIVKGHVLSIDEVNAEYGEDVASIIKGLVKTNELYAKSPAIESENFRNLLLSFAEDMRVILIMIADRVNIMRQIKECKNDEARRQVANEAAYLYAPLAHKLGLYKLKSELEDLSLKYTEKEVYYHIKEKLNETKASRDKHIAAFIVYRRCRTQNNLSGAGIYVRFGQDCFPGLNAGIPCTPCNVPAVRGSVSVRLRNDARIQIRNPHRHHILAVRSCSIDEIFFHISHRFCA